MGRDDRSQQSQLAGGLAERASPVAFRREHRLPGGNRPCDLLPQDRSRGYAYNGTGFDTYLLGRGDDRPPG